MQNRMVCIGLLFAQVAAGCLSVPSKSIDSDGPAFVRGQSEAMSGSTSRTLTLRQAIERSLHSSDVVRTLGGSVAVERTTHLDPEIRRAALGAERAAFDPRIEFLASGRKVDDPPSSFFGPGIETETRRDEGLFGARLVKPWSQGTETSIGYDPSTAYLNFPRSSDPDVFNPSYSSRLSFELKQPLLRGASREANVVPIRIARARVEQSIWEVQGVTLAQIRSVEQAYWNLHAAHVRVRAVQEVVPLAEESVRIAEERVRAERGIRADAMRAGVELERLRQRLAAERLDVRRREFDLRQLLDLPVEDGFHVLPVDPPEVRPPAMDAEGLAADALDRRPDLLQRRLEVEIRGREIVRLRNGILPQLDVRAQYRTNGLGNELDDSLTQMGDFSYDDLSLGITLEMPLGNRRARAETRGAELQFARERALLTAHEQRVRFEVAIIVAELESTWERFRSSRRQVEQSREWLRVSRIRYENPQPGRDSLLLLLADFQQAIRQYLDAVANAGDLLAEYNGKLAELDESVGGALETWQVEFGTEEFEPVVPIGMAVGLPSGYVQSPYRSYRVSPVLQQAHAGRPVAAVEGGAGGPGIAAGHSSP